MFTLRQSFDLTQNDSRTLRYSRQKPDVCFFFWSSEKEELEEERWRRTLMFNPKYIEFLFFFYGFKLFMFVQSSLQITDYWRESSLQSMTITRLLLDSQTPGSTQDKSSSQADSDTLLKPTAAGLNRSSCVIQLSRLLICYGTVLMSSH